MSESDLDGVGTKVAHEVRLPVVAEAGRKYLLSSSLKLEIGNCPHLIGDR
jgi:hypothetical protein